MHQCPSLSLYEEIGHVEGSLDYNLVDEGVMDGCQNGCEMGLALFLVNWKRSPGRREGKGITIKRIMVFAKLHTFRSRQMFLCANLKEETSGVFLILI